MNYIEDLNETVGLLWEKLEAWGDQAVLILPNLLLAILLVILTFYVAGFVRNWAGKFGSRFSHSQALVNLFLTLLYTGILLVGFFFALSVLRLDKVVVSLLAGVGVVGLALGFAFKDIAANFISGIIIAVQRPFRVGDNIETNEYFGTIERISLRTIDIRQVTGEMVHLPNKTVFENPLTNFSIYGTRRIDLEVGISYAEDLERVQRVVTEALQEVKNRLVTRDIEVMFDAFGDSSINFKARFWVSYRREVDYVSARSDAIIRIKKAFDANDILIPFPIRTLDFGIKGGEKLNEQLRSVNASFKSGFPLGNNGQ
ncbi:mechanosensitive ion channel-like protein [Pontibacter ummariensis]|uniref:Mechanosensitive ion channel n=1 Tax=Pontibacter ummariensis TaxID=1610492 RepID=A0A239HWG4_9BACT|nr:mechanosensitive ion channel family protein [Pontibacter ummariensis]PRY10090.1 mechanosensitive ion channel-like protein [Pontibacter ummariensis]SNS85622.1 Mechanosensitive ion channel [Pontibacter ummariensis]